MHHSDSMLALSVWAVGTMTESLPALQDEAKWDGWLVDSSVKTCEDLKDLYDDHDCCSDASFSDEYLTFRRPNNICPIGWRTLEVSGESTRCVKLVDRSVWTYQQAVEACTAEGGGAHLIRPTSVAKDTAVKALIGTLSSTIWRFFWIDTYQSSTEQEEDQGWTWGNGTAVSTALVSSASSTNRWAQYQPTTFNNVPNDGPEDCVLYGSYNPVNPATHLQDTSVGWWWDFGCSPSAAVVCMTPYINIPGFMTGCWGGPQFSNVTIESTNDLCLLLLPDEAYNLQEARSACTNHNGILVYTKSVIAQKRLDAWVSAKGGGHTKVWLNLEQKGPASIPGIGNPKLGWTIPTGEELAETQMAWNSPSDPEPVEAQHDQALLLLDGANGYIQDTTPMNTGAGALCERAP